MASATLAAMHTDSLLGIDAFLDTVWLEDGLSKNTLDAYRRDLSLYAGWLALPAQGSRALNTTITPDI